MDNIIDNIFDIRIKLFNEDAFVAYYFIGGSRWPVVPPKYAVFSILDGSLIQMSGFSETGIDLVKEWYKENKQKLMKAKEELWLTSFSLKE